MLEAAEADGHGSIVSWLPDQTSFKVHNQAAFVNNILPRYFNQTKYRSFQRQLNVWGYERISDGPGKGGYKHKHFVRNNPSLCHNMKRERTKGTKKRQSVKPPKKVESSHMPVRLSSSFNYMSSDMSLEQTLSLEQALTETGPLNKLPTLTEKGDLEDFADDYGDEDSDSDSDEAMEFFLLAIIENSLDIFNHIFRQLPANAHQQHLRVTDNGVQRST